MERANPHLVERIKKLGAFDLQACYSCGNCSALCPLSEGDISFPRKMIRYALLGLEGKIISSPDPWLCYYCGECSETCPREADPGGLMMALRRFTIRRYSFGRIADLFYSAFASGIAWVFLSALVIIAIVLFHNPDMNLEEVEWLSFISLEHIHNIGIALMSFMVLAFIANTAAMAAGMRKNLPPGTFTVHNLKKRSMPVLRETLLQSRFSTCEGNKYRHYAHLALVWGFAGMTLATITVMGIDYEWWPISRTVPFLLGSVFGILTFIGGSYFFYLRITRRKESAKYSHHSDWIFLLLILLAVLSGFVMVIFKFADLPRAGYIAFAVHLVFVFNLLVSLPFTKFAHAVYRPLALFLAGVRLTQAESESDAS
jgi:heterodisulfide reductase subunit C